MISTSNPSIVPPPEYTVTKWAGIAGRWNFDQQRAIYLGPDESRTQHPFGLALAAGRFRDGLITTKVRLSRSERTSAGIVFGYQSLNAPYLMAQLGAHDYAFSISEHRPGTGWVALSAAGSVANIQDDREYEIALRVYGQSIQLSIDDVDVLTTLVPQPIEGSGFGLFAWDDAQVDFMSVLVAGSAPRVFVIMPFAEPFDTLYRDVILPVAKEEGFDVVRVDEIFAPGVIMDDIQQQIAGAHAVVAEISSHNPNVFYELGYAHALRKPSVLLVRRQQSTEMPFDVKGYRAIFYDDSIGGKKHVEKNLRQHLNSIARDN